jgi:hypothetical protein
MLATWPRVPSQVRAHIAQSLAYTSCKFLLLDQRLALAYLEAGPYADMHSCTRKTLREIRMAAVSLSQ